MEKEENTRDFGPNLTSKGMGVEIWCLKAEGKMNNGFQPDEQSDESDYDPLESTNAWKWGDTVVI